MITFTFQFLDMPWSNVTRFAAYPPPPSPDYLPSFLPRGGLSIPAAHRFHRMPIFATIKPILMQSDLAISWKKSLSNTFARAFAPKAYQIGLSLLMHDESNIFPRFIYPEQLALRLFRGPVAEKNCQHFFDPTGSKFDYDPGLDQNKTFFSIQSTTIVEFDTAVGSEKYW